MTSAEAVFMSKIDKANNGHYYIHVSKKGDVFKTSHIKLSGYRQMFEKTPDFMYVYTLRHAGLKEDLMGYLTKAGFPEDEIRKVLSNDSYTGTNFVGKQRQIDLELANVPVVKKDEKKSISLNYIISLKEVLDKTKITKQAADDACAAPSTPKSRVKNDLKSRLDGLSEDKVLDITSFDAATNGGIKTAKRTVKGTRRPLAASGDLNRVVYDYAKGNEVAEKALVFLGMTEAAARNAVKAAMNNKTASLSRVAISPR